MPVTALYAALLAPLFILLAVRVIRSRREAKVAVGDGGDKALLRRMRVHANFAEYVPLALILMALAESLAANRFALHATAIALLAVLILSCRRLLIHCFPNQFATVYFGRHELLLRWYGRQGLALNIAQSNSCPLSRNSADARRD